MKQAPPPTDMPSWCRLGLGTGTLASLGRAASLKEVEILLDAMEQLEIHTVDTADSYGSGDCEHLLARALEGRRDRFRIITKAGYCHGNLPGPLRPLNQFVKKGLQRLGFRQRFDTGYLKRCVDNSLRRLRTDRVEAFLLHDPPLEVIQSGSLGSLFMSLKQQGKTLMTGVSSGEPDVLEQAVKSGLCDLIENPANVGVANRMEEIWSLCQHQGIHVVGNHVFDPQSLRRAGMNHEQLMKASSALLPPGSTILCGTRKPAHLRQAHEWALNPLAREDARQLCGNVQSSPS